MTFFKKKVQSLANFSLLYALKTAPTAPISINTAKPTAKNVGTNVNKDTIIGKITKKKNNIF